MVWFFLILGTLFLIAVAFSFSRDEPKQVEWSDPLGRDQDSLLWEKSFQVVGWSREFVLIPDRKDPAHGWELEIDGRRVSWRSVRYDDRIWSAPVVGNQYRPAKAQRVFRSGKMDPGWPVVLRRDPENQYDSNAVEVWDRNRTAHVGFLPKEWAKVVAKELDAGRAVRAWSIWESVDDVDSRVGLNLLLLREGLEIEEWA